jgi:Domain of unknown function (DUF1844)
MAMKEEGDEKERGFKVQDRRRFSAEGEVKPGAEEAKPEPAPSPSGPRPGVEAPAAVKAGEGAGAGGEDAGADPELNFATFIVGLSTEALAALGEMPHPATGQHGRDLRAARQLIDILGILRDKTRGNLDRDEESLFEAILYDLRMKYVELARQP